MAVVARWFPGRQPAAARAEQPVAAAVGEG
jgi:hypothetical protein